MPHPPPIADRINAERIVLFGWSRAILLQVAHPLVAAGVAGHSSFRESPVASARRLHQTVRAMLALTFGGAERRAKAIADIQAIHRRVNGTLREGVGAFPTGTRYSAEDPALLLWVHATLLDSAVRAYESLVGPVTPAERDAYCQAAASVALDLGANESDVPRDWAALSRYLEGMLESGRIRVGADARAVSTALLSGGFSRLTGPFAWANRQLTAGWLPEGLRDEYGFRWTSRDERQFMWLQRRLRQLRRVLPGAVALWPEARRD